MRFILKIELGNDAMQTGDDIAWAIQGVARQIVNDGTDRVTGHKIMDVNGNSVGCWDLAEADIMPEIQIYCKDRRTGSVSEQSKLKLGTYNEFYLPALLDHRDREMWITATDSDGNETRLHLKR